MEEIHRTAGRIHFPFIHNWSYRGTECPKEAKPYLKLTRPVPHNYETSRRGVITAIRSASGQLGVVAIQPVAGCKSIQAGAIVYDTLKNREIAFPNLRTDYTEQLLNRIRNNRSPVELRGVTKSDGGECFVSLLWAR